MKFFNEGKAGEYHDSTHDNSPKNAPKKDFMLIWQWGVKRFENEEEYKKIIDAKRLFHKICG